MRFLINWFKDLYLFHDDNYAIPDPDGVHWIPTKNIKRRARQEKWRKQIRDKRRNK